MRILHVSTSDVSGGAAIAAMRLHKGLIDAGVDSRLAVLSRRSNTAATYSVAGIIGHFWHRLSTRLTRDILHLTFRKPISLFDPAWFSFGINRIVRRHRPDILHLHWTNRGFLRPESISRLNIPIVWTLHDMWPFTGGCHHSEGCDRYSLSCGKCPKLNGDSVNDLSHKVWLRKQKAWKNANLFVVVVSRWMERCISSSSLLGNRPYKRIPYGVDSNAFFRGSKHKARKHFNLPGGRKLVLFVSAYGHAIKGADLLALAFSRIARPEVDLLIVGNPAAIHFATVGERCHMLGRIEGQSAMRDVYSAADVLVAPSRQDNLPNAVLEAMACGTPAVAFDIGGMPDMIKHNKTGYLARPFDVDDLVVGLEWVLEKEERMTELSAAARTWFEEHFTMEHQVRRMQAFYDQISSEAVV